MATPRHGRPLRRLTAVVLTGSMLFGCMPDGEVDVSEQGAQDVQDLANPPAAAAILEEDRGDPPATLRAEDLVEGDGPRVRSGDRIEVQYLGVRWSDGEQFASSWATGDPLHVELGAERVIPGWERGILGEDMENGPVRVGGRRLLIVPPDLAYGDTGAGSRVPPGETLVFVIDVVSRGGS